MERVWRPGLPSGSPWAEQRSPIGSTEGVSPIHIFVFRGICSHLYGVERQRLSCSLLQVLFYLPLPARQLLCPLFGSRQSPRQAPARTRVGDVLKHQIRVGASD